MELGEPDERRSPLPVPGSDFVIQVDTVILALGITPNPILIRSTPGLETDRKGCVVADPETGATSRPAVFAGGDVVTGAATIILAMGAGQRAARAIQYLQEKARTGGPAWIRGGIRVIIAVGREGFPVQGEEGVVLRKGSRAALVAAFYVAVTGLLAPTSFGPVQRRSVWLAGIPPVVLNVPHRPTARPMLRMWPAG